MSNIQVYPRLVTLPTSANLLISVLTRNYPPNFVHSHPFLPTLPPFAVGTREA